MTVSTIPTPDGADGITDTLNFVRSKRDAATTKVGSLDDISNSSPDGELNSFFSDFAESEVWERISTGPLAQMGKDFIAEQVATNGATLINNATTILKDKLSPLTDPLEQAHAVVFDAIASAMIAKNDIAMMFIKKVAEKAIESIEKKREILLRLKDKLRELYNALVLMVAADPFFSKYLKRLREALILIVTAENELILVRNTLQSRDAWLKRKYDQAISNLEAADLLLEPERTSEPDQKITDSGLLANVGVPSEPQQLTTMLAVPKLCKEVMALANGYLLANLKTNALLLAFIQAYEQLTASSSTMMKKFTINTLDNIIGDLDDLVSDMALNINGHPDFIEIPVSGFKPDSVKVSTGAMNWIIKLKTILTYAKVVPGDSLAAITASNKALLEYNRAVEFIKTKDTVEDGNAVLTATDGREDVGQLEIQLTTFTLAALQAIVDGKAADSILALGRTLQNRFDLSYQQDLEIQDALQRFINADLGLDDTIDRMGKNITGLLDRFGLDRAKDLLEGGSFKDFFNLNGKLATYSGAALLGISAMQNCLGTEEDREQLNQVKREIQRDQKSKEILSKRLSATGFEQRSSNLKKDIKGYNDLEQKTIKSVERVKLFGKCDVPEGIIPSNPLATIGSVMGIGLASNGLPDDLSKLGQGIL